MCCNTQGIACQTLVRGDFAEENTMCCVMLCGMYCVQMCFKASSCCLAPSSFSSSSAPLWVDSQQQHCSTGEPAAWCATARQSDAGGLGFGGVVDSARAIRTTGAWMWLCASASCYELLFVCKVLSSGTALLGAAMLVAIGRLVTNGCILPVTVQGPC